MPSKNTFKPGVEQATHALTILFGLTSLANVDAFLRQAGHDPLAATALSVALGAALIVVSIALTRLDWQTEKQAFRSLIIVGLALAIISGALQSSTYARHLGGLWPYLLGYGVPLVGEVGLSLAAALFSKAQRRAELRAVNTKIEQAIITNLDHAINAFDPSLIQKRIDKALNRVALAAVSGVENNLLALYNVPAAPIPAEPIPVSEPVSEPVNEPASQPVSELVNEPVSELAELTDTSPIVAPDLTLANQVRLSQKAANMDKAFALIRCGDRSMNAIADEIGVTTKTISRYIETFRQQGHAISANGVVKLVQ